MQPFCRGAGFGRALVCHRPLPGELVIVSVFGSRPGRMAEASALKPPLTGPWHLLHCHLTSFEKLSLTPTSTGIVFGGPSEQACHTPSLKSSLMETSSSESIYTSMTHFLKFLLYLPLPSNPLIQPSQLIFFLTEWAVPCLVVVLFRNVQLSPPWLEYELEEARSWS